MEIEGYPSYLIYDDGRVYSKYKNIFLKQNKTAPGYLCCNLYENGKTKQFLIHRLVASHYLPILDNLSCVDHIDRDTTNNHVSNLRWCNHSQNAHNRTASKNNKSGIKNIYRDRKGYRFQKIYNGKNHHKWFKTLEGAISYKEEFYNKLNDEFCIMG